MTIWSSLAVVPKQQISHYISYFELVGRGFDALQLHYIINLKVVYMAKVNFTKEHYAKMKELAFAMLVSNHTISTKLGQPLNIVELMHTQTVNTLNNIRLSLGKQIDDLEKQDEWIATDYQQEKLEALKKKKELVNLIIGWKRHNAEIAETKAKKAELTKQLEELKDSQKTPEDRIKELEAQLKDLDTTEEF